MRLLILTETFHPDTTGGAGRVAAEEARQLAALGVEVRVLTRLTERATEREEDRDGYRIFRFPAERGLPHQLFLSTRQGVSTCLTAATADWRPDLVDIHQPHVGFHLLRCPGLCSVPLVYHFHSSWADELKAKGGRNRLLAPLAARMEKRVLKQCDAVVVLSEYSRGRVDKLARRGPVTVVPGGVDLDRFPLKPDAPANPTPVLLTVRNLVRRMGLDLLLDAAGLLMHQGRDYRLLIAGHGPLRHELEVLARPLGERCRFLGSVAESDLARLYQEADLFVLPTAAIEGFGLVILEAFASGTPVVGTPVGAIPEQVARQGEGYVAEEASATGLARAIARFLDRPDRIAPARLRALAADLSWRRRAERLLDLYQQVIAGRR